MKQLTLRVAEELAEHLKVEADRRGESVNSYATGVLSAAVDPDLAADEFERLRERLARAGLLARPIPSKPMRRPSADQVAKAQKAAGSGRQLSDLISEGRD